MDERGSANRDRLKYPDRTTMTIHPITKKRIRATFRELSPEDTRMKSDDLFINKILDTFHKQKKIIIKLTQICADKGVTVHIEKQELNLV